MIELKFDDIYFLSFTDEEEDESEEEESDDEGKGKKTGSAKKPRTSVSTIG